MSGGVSDGGSREAKKKTREAEKKTLPEGKRAAAKESAAEAIGRACHRESMLK